MEEKYINIPSMSFSAIVSGVWGWKWNIQNNLNSGKVRLNL